MTRYKWAIYKVLRRRNSAHVLSYDDLDRVIASSDAHAISLVFKSRRALGEDPCVESDGQAQRVISTSGDLLEYEYSVAKATGADARA